MDGDVGISRTGMHSAFTTRNILRVLVLLMLVFVFCPSFLVSCSDIDEEFQISAWTAVNGISTSAGSEVMESQPRMIICLVLPILAGVLLCIKALAGRVCAVSVLGCTALDIIFWLRFQETVKNVAKENLCEFETLGCFYINITVMCAIMLLSLLVLVGVLELDKNMIIAFCGGTRAPVEEKKVVTREVEEERADEELEKAKSTEKVDVKLKIRMPGYGEESKYFESAQNLDGMPIEKDGKKRL